MADTQGHFEIDILRTEFEQRRSPSHCYLIKKPINQTPSQSSIKCLAVIDDVNTCRLAAACEDHGRFDSVAVRALKVVRTPTSWRHVQRRLASEIASVKDFEKVKFAASGDPAGAVGVGAVLGCKRDLGIHEPDRWHVSVEARCGTLGHGEFEEEHFVVAAEAICD